MPAKIYNYLGVSFHECFASGVLLLPLGLAAKSAILKDGHMR